MENIYDCDCDGCDCGDSGSYNDYGGDYNYGVVHEDELCSSSSSSWVLDSSTQFSWSSSGSCSLLADWIHENRNYAW